MFIVRVPRGSGVDLLWRRLPPVHNRHIRCNHDVLAVDWSSKRQIWSVDVDVKGKKHVLEAQFIIGGTGFFDYKQPQSTAIPGLDRFQGKVALPQFWPIDLDYTNKKVIVIGSGATAIKITPVIAQKASSTVMLQRSPTYIISMAMQSNFDSLIRHWLPSNLAYKTIAWRFTLMASLFFCWSRFFPRATRNALEAMTTKELAPGIKLCVCPDGDFFRAMDDGKAQVVTGVIETVEEDGALLTSGKKIEADIIVTATGLKLQMLGGAKLTIDKDRRINIGEQYMWRGTMLQDVPNLMIVIGYWNNSWTLGSDLAVRIFLKNVRAMEKQHSARSFTPIMEEGEEKKLARRPSWNIASTYLQNSTYPKASTAAPWTVKDNYMRDWFVMMFGDLQKGLKFGSGA